MTLLEQATNLYSRGLLDDALRLARNGLAIEPQNEARLCEIAAASAFALGDLALAEQFWRQAIILRPKAADTHYNLGTLLARTGREAAAEEFFSRATALNPQFADAYSALGRCHANGRRTAEAEKCFRKALALDPKLATAHFQLGHLLFESGRHKDAENCYRRAIALDADLAEAFNNLGDLLSKSGRESEAEKCFRRAIALDPGFADAHYNLGNLMSGLSRDGDAQRCYRDAIAVEPGFARAHMNLGLLLEKRDQNSEAEQCYRNAIACGPDLADAYYNLGNLLCWTDRAEQAEPCFRRAIELNGGHADAFVSLAHVLMESARYDEAEAAYRSALAIKPEHAYLLPTIIYAANYSFSWQQFDHDVHRLRTCLGDDDALSFAPFPLLAIPGFTPLEQLRAGRRFAEKQWNANPPSAPEGRSNRLGHHGRIRIGYLSAHFHAHAVSEACASVLESHDTSAFAVHGYSYGPDIQDAMRKRVRSACELFRELRPLKDEVAARQIADDKIDILVDLVGYTGGCRPGIAALRPAPVVVNWLGYAGTLGHSRLADYIIGDPIATPLAHAGHFSESLALMSHCYMPYDRNRTVGARPSRREAGLPEGKFVFCSFNKGYKLNPETFEVWCRLLREVPQSILWLPWSSDAAVANLRMEATARGVDPERLFFARPVNSIGEYLGRLQLADLALDTYPYTSHTTGCDALWAGVPMVTRIGETFASRVGASLLHAVGLPELIVEDWAAYLALAKSLALNPAMLEAHRGRLAASRLTAPLFDTAQFARDLEELYRMIWQQHQNGASSPVVLRSP